MTMEKTLAVIPGTFNPVTKAHIHMGEIIRQLMPEAMVVYVPTKTGFLQSWKHMDMREIMPDEARAHLLQDALSGTGFTVDLCEINDETTGKTFDTLTYLAKKYGVDKKNLWWVCGTDKLTELNRWYRADDIMSTFRLIVIQRNDDDSEREIRENPFLSKYRDRITLVPDEEKYLTISSTKVRNAMDEGHLENVRNLLPDAVYERLTEEMKGEQDNA